MNVIDQVSLNLDFEFKYPFFLSIESAISRFDQLNKLATVLAEDDANRDLVYRLLNEAEHIIDSIEGYQL